MQANIHMRHRGETRPSSLMGARSGVDRAPGRANDFRRKCSEYTGPARWRWVRPAPAAIARRLP
jgi:hypothetical protein